jgi:hypothetical protein
MQDISVKVWRSRRTAMWCVKINGKKYKSPTFAGIQDAVRRAVADLKEAAEAEAKRKE